MNRVARAVLVVLAAAASLTAQQLSLGTASKHAGQTANLSVLLATQGAQVAGVQFDLNYDKTNLSITAAVGAAATAAGKSITTQNSTSGLRIIVIGFNQDVMANGSVADLTIQIAANAPAATYPITFANVSATDPNANNIVLGTSNGAITLGGALAIAPSSLPVATVNAAYLQTMTASGGTTPYTWSATGLPGGLAIASGTGAISGIPATSVGSPFNVQVTVTDSNSVTANQSYSLAVNPSLVISSPASLAAGTLNVAYPVTVISATGGSGLYSWSATGLPAGLTINPGNGSIAGTPNTDAGSPFNVQVSVTDSNTVRTTRGYTLIVNGPLSISGPASLPAGTLNVAYPSTFVTATGGTGTYLWSATGLPQGLSINAGSGLISGTPTTTAGSPFNVQVTVTDSSAATARISYSLPIGTQTTPIPLAISGPSALPAGIVNVTYAAISIVAQGGSGSYTWSATGLPQGLTINSATGAISGTPSNSAGSPYAVQVTVTDSTSAQASRGYTLAVNAQLSISGPASLPVGIVNVAYMSTTVTATGGSGTYTWSATGLPIGLNIGFNTGAITGTPATNVGSPFNVQVTVTDSNSSRTSVNYTLAVNLSPVTLPLIGAVSNAAAGQPAVAANTWVSIYGSNFAPQGFTDDWSKSIVNGKLPITLDGVSVTAGGQPAYVAYLSTTQINVLLPELGFGSVQLTVTTPAGTSAPVTVVSQQYSPAFFPWPNNQPVATHADYSLAAKNGTFAGTTTIPAKPGEVIILWCAGFGSTNPPAASGFVVPVSPTEYTADPVTVTVGNIPASVYGAALASGFAGLYQIVVTVPPSMPNGDFAVVATINGAQTPSATLTVQN